MAIDPTALAAFSAATATRPSAPGAPLRAVAHDFRQTLADTLGQLDAPEGSAPRELPTRQSAHAAQAPEGVSAHQELVRLPGEPPAPWPVAAPTPAVQNPAAQAVAARAPKGNEVHVLIQRDPPPVPIQPAPTQPEQLSAPAQAPREALAKPQAACQFSDGDKQALRAWSSAVTTASAQPATRRRSVKITSVAQAESPAAVAVAKTEAEAAPQPDALIRRANAQLGKRYTPGGSSPRQGFDCSGLTSYVYSSEGVELPRSSREQYAQGKPVEHDDLRKGDLVFFGKKGVSHVGIYVNDGKFIHSASGGKTVTVSDLDDPNWKGIFAGARRVF